MTDPQTQENNASSQAAGGGGFPLPVDPLVLARQLLRKLWVFGLLAVLSAAIGVGLAIKFGTRTWRAEVVLVCAKGTPAAIADIITFPNIKTLENMVKLRDNIDEVRSRLKLPVAVNELGSQIDVIGERSSALMSIRATAGDPKLAAAVANTMAQVFIENQKELNRQEAARLAKHYRQEYEQAVVDAKEAEDALNKF
jgi:capsular polysaccharide biosynthesis protein